MIERAVMPALPISDGVRYQMIQATKLALAQGYDSPHAAHVIIYICTFPRSVATLMLSHIGIDVDELRMSVAKFPSETFHVNDCVDPLSILRSAEAIALRYNSSIVDCEHLLLACIRLRGNAIESALNSFSLTGHDVEQSCDNLLLSFPNWIKSQPK